MFVFRSIIFFRCVGPTYIRREGRERGKKKVPVAVQLPNLSTEIWARWIVSVGFRLR